MRNIDNDIRASLERLTNPHDGTPGTEALWGDLVDRRRKRRNRKRTLAALPLLLVAVLAVGILATRDSSDSARSDVAAGRADTNSAGDATVAVSLDRPLSIDVATSELSDSDEGWLQHTITVTNTADHAIRFNYLRSATEVFGDREVAVTTESCTYPDDRSILDFVCEDGEPTTIDPNGTYEFTATLWKDLPDMNAVATPTGTWDIPVEYWNAIPADDSADTTPALLTVTYDNLGTSGDCASADSRPSARCDAVYGPVMFGPEQHSVMEQARLAGRVLLEGDCLYLMQESDAARYAPVPIVWPYGTLWEEDPAGVRLPDGAFVPVGAEITAAGGGHDIDRLTELGHAESVAGRARQCAGDDIQVVAYVQGEIEVLPDEQAPLDSSQGKGFVLKFLATLLDGDFEAAAMLWSGYPVSEPDRPISERVQYVEQLAEYPPFARIVASDNTTTFVTPSTANHGGHVVTIMDPRSGDSPPVAAAFLTGLSGDGDDQRWWIHRLPAIDAAADAELSDDGYVEPGEQVVVPGLPVEGGVRGFVNSTEVPVEVDLENETFTFVVPESASGDIALTFVVATPEEPIVRAFAVTVR